MATVPFEGIELQNHEPGYSGGIDHRKGTYYNVPRMDSKVNNVDLHIHHNSSAIIYTKKYSIIMQENKFM